MSIDYSPTGREFVTGGYDRTVRLFNSDEGRSREVYHTKRMQRLVKNERIFFSEAHSGFSFFFAHGYSCTCFLTSVFSPPVCRIFTVKFSADAKYVLSGSDDTNIRVWKAQASMPIKPVRLDSISFTLVFHLSCNIGNDWKQTGNV
jgi:WD repeat and SOF domain-containing protein 1